MLVAFLVIMVAVGFTALLNRIMFKIGVRNIPRRPAQTVLIIIGLMLSTLIISAALGTGDTLSFSIRNEVITGLGEIDELLTSGRSVDLDDFRSDPYFPAAQFEELRASIGDDDRIDGLAPMIAETAPVVNPVARQSAGSMKITAVDPAEVGIFGPILSMSGSPVRLEDLEGNEVFINEAAAEELEAGTGDTLQLFVQGDTVELVVRDVVQKGGLAGNHETMLISLSRAQEIFGVPGQINSILVSNRGDSKDGADLSDEVTEFLRGLLTNREVAEQITAVLNDADIISEIRSRAEDQPDSLKQDLLDAASLLETGETTPELINLLADEGTAAQLMLAVEAQKDQIATFQAFGLFSELNRLNVRDIKADLLDIANLASSAITSIFVIFGTFSIIAGIMLIFLIFVMLAAERKPEMGIARAIGMRRSHLVQSFVFEGLTYDLLSALVGATLGIVVGMLMVTVMANIFSDSGENFTLIRHYTLTSFIISYCAGVVLTFISVLISSYRSSRLNIVSAIRDLPEVFAPSQQEPRLKQIGRALVRPFIFLVRAVKDLRNWRIRRFVLNLVLAVLWVIPPIWIGGILWALARMSSPALSRGWLTVILGALLVILGIAINQAWAYTIGVTIAVIGLGLMLRWLFTRRQWPASRQNRFTGAAIGAVCLFWLGVGIGQGQALTVVLAILAASFELIRQIAMSRERALGDPEDRNAFTFIGLSMIIFWGAPFDALDFMVPDLDSNIEMFLISGVSMVTAAVWVIIYNADLITDGVTAVFGRFSRLRPALKMAVAYALNSKLRTGLTLAMLSLVIFTLIVMSTLTTSFSAALEDIDSVTGGWDISVAVSFNNPVDDFKARLTQALGEQAGDIEAVGGYTTIPVEVRQVGADTQEWKGYRVQGANESFLEYNAHDIQLFSKEFGETKEEIWAALRENPGLAVIDAFAVPSRTGGGQFSFGGPQFKMEGFFLEDDDMTAVEVEIRDLRSGKVAKVTVIGVLDTLADRFGVIITSKSVIDEISDEPVPFTVYRLRVGPEADVDAISRSVESSFLENGLESFVLADEIAEDREANIAINRLFQGFMATGLLVGIAALGVISFRAVVERRQQIGVLKALGYRRSMILTSYLMESSFIAFLG
ncbi:MAG: FtsX-like permease family protein, partial [Chloroflexi bacterium]|nr:FtsX-like permease family protein [Chloroflexota bacterium]